MMQRTIQVKGLIKDKQLDSPYTNLYNTICSVGDYYKEITCIPMLYRKDQVGIIFSVIHKKDNCVVLHLMHCNESNIAIWKDNQKIVLAQNTLKDEEIIKGEAFLLAIKDKHYFLNCYKNFHDSFAMEALFYVYKQINQDNRLSDDNYVSISATYMANAKILEKIKKEGIKTIHFKFLTRSDALQEYSSPSEFKSGLLNSCVAPRTKTKDKGLAKTKDKGLAQVKVEVSFVSMDLREDLVASMIDKSPDDENQFKITTNIGNVIEYGSIVFKRTVNVKNRENTDLMDPTDIKGKMLEYYSTFDNNNVILPK